MERRDRQEALALAAVLAVALALRVAYILGQRSDVLFDFPVIDEERYVAMGRALALGHVPDPRPWFHPPGLVYALGLVFRVAGPGLMVPRLVQAVVSTASCFLTFAVAKSFFSSRVALGAAAICAVHGVLVFEAYELLPPTWMLAADLGALLLLFRAGDRRTSASSFVAGGALGIAALFGPTVLPFGLVAIAWLRKPALAAAFVAGVALPIAPVTWGNWERGHEVVLVSTNGGINFFIGNNERYDETLAIRPGPRWDDLRARPRRAGVEGEAAASAYFTHEAVAFWREHPARAVGLYLRKLYLYFDGPEIPRDTDIQAMRSSSTLLGVLVTRGPPWLPDGIVVPLALVGAFAHWRDRRRLALLFSFVALQALVVSAFFVTSRYRVPALPLFAIFGAAGVEAIALAWRGATGVRRVLPVVLCLLAVISFNVTTRESSTSYAAELDFYRGLELRIYLHDSKRALTSFLHAATADPKDGRYWFEVANTLEASGQEGDAIEAWRQAGDVDPWDARARRKLAVVLASRGDLDGAIAAARANVDSRTHDAAFYAPDHLNLALLEARRGHGSRAADELHAAERADPSWFRSTLPGFARGALASADVVDPVFWRSLAELARGAGLVDMAAACSQRADAGVTAN